MAVFSRSVLVNPSLIGSRAPARIWSSTWMHAFVIFQIVCQLALLSSYIGSLRALVRMAAFGASLLLLVLVPGRGRGLPHPANLPARCVLAIVGLSFFHPMTNGLVSGAAHAAMYLAILGPLFWVPRLGIDLAALRRVMLILWIFHTLSAGVGVLQVYFPGRFQPSLSSVIAAMDEGYIGQLYI
ncbi:MAG: hypothetical protein ACRDHG_15005, partial [Anaerolineales bacterium]